MNKCPVPNCPRARRRGHLMCSEHWRRVPGDVKRRVLAVTDRIEGHTAALQAIESVTDHSYSQTEFTFTTGKRP